MGTAFMAREGKGPTPASWQPGRSGNPAGRPKSELSRLTAEAARDLGPEMIEVLASLARDEATPAAARVSAATAVLDRGFGRPKQSVEAEVTTHSWVDVLRSLPPAVDIGEPAETGEDVAAALD